MPLMNHTQHVDLCRSRFAPLQVFCRTDATAQNISRAVGQAVSSAVPAVSADAPCKPYAGNCMRSCQTYRSTGMHLILMHFQSTSIIHTHFDVRHAYTHCYENTCASCYCPVACFDLIFAGYCFKHLVFAIALLV